MEFMHCWVPYHRKVMSDHQLTDPRSWNRLPQDQGVVVLRLVVETVMEGRVSMQTPGHGRCWFLDLL